MPRVSIGRNFFLTSKLRTSWLLCQGRKLLTSWCVCAKRTTNSNGWEPMLPMRRIRPQIRTHACLSPWIHLQSQYKADNNSTTLVSSQAVCLCLRIRNRGESTMRYRWAKTRIWRQIRQIAPLMALVCTTTKTIGEYRGWLAFRENLITVRSRAPPTTNSPNWIRCRREELELELESRKVCVIWTRTRSTWSSSHHHPILLKCDKVIRGSSKVERMRTIICQSGLVLSPWKSNQCKLINKLSETMLAWSWSKWIVKRRCTVQKRSWSEKFLLPWQWVQPNHRITPQRTRPIIRAKCLTDPPIWPRVRLATSHLIQTRGVRWEIRQQIIIILIHKHTSPKLTTLLRQRCKCRKGPTKIRWARWRPKYKRNRRQKRNHSPKSKRLTKTMKPDIPNKLLETPPPFSNPLSTCKS